MHKGFADLSLTSWVRRLAERLSGVNVQNKKGFVQSADVPGGFGADVPGGFGADVPGGFGADVPGGFGAEVFGAFGAAW